MEHIKIGFLVKRTRVNSRGLCPIVGRISSGGESSEISISNPVPIEYWDNVKQRVKSKHPNANLINARITDVEAQLQQLAADLRLQRRPVSPYVIKQLFLGKEKEFSTLNYIFKRHNEDVRKTVGTDYSKATYLKYELTRHKVLRFLKFRYSKDDIELQHLNHSFVSDFEIFLKSEDSLDHNTAMKHIKNLKKVIRLAIKLELLNKNPFDNFECPINPVHRICLTQIELNRMMQKQTLNRRLEVVRDVFVFCCYTGLSYSDVAKLNSSHIHQTSSKMRMLVIDRTKTGNISRVPLLEGAEQLIKKYDAFNQCCGNRRLFPVTSNQRMNEYLKEIATLCDIDKHLTVHVARHTFATTICLSNGVSLEVVRTALAHSSIKTTEIYAKMTDLRLNAEMEKLNEQLRGF